MIFLHYESKPVTRMAFQITHNHVIVKPKVRGGADYSIAAIFGPGNVITAAIKFKAHEEPKVGDWIIRVTEEDTYHCTDAVFRERNIVSVN